MSRRCKHGTCYRPGDMQCIQVHDFLLDVLCVFNENIHPHCLIVDIRSKDAYDASHIANTLNVPQGDVIPVPAEIECVYLIDEESTCPHIPKARDLHNAVIQLTGHVRVVCVIGGFDAIARLLPHMIQPPFLSMGNVDDIPSQIINNIYIGNIMQAADPFILSAFDIRTVVCVLPTNVALYDPYVKYHHVPLRDEGGQDLTRAIDNAVKAIDEGANSGHGVLVHCLAGVSRAPTMVIAYLMIKLHMPLPVALDLVQQRRHIIDPNLDFMGALQSIDRRLDSVSEQST